jgi:Zn-dependent peptidase ImmA (M78 family)
MGAPLFTKAEDLLIDLGITEPNELEIEVIAQHCKATVTYKPLRGCAARIMGNEDRAIITIDSESRPERQRFSAAHELGHWMFDRGKISLFSCEENTFIREWSKSNPETRANRYASDLLLPVPMFKPRAATCRTIDFNAVKGLSKIFTTSLTATAIRMVEHGPLPAMLICSSSQAIEWFVRSDTTKRLWPQLPSHETYAHDVFDGDDDRSGNVLASAWFDHPIANRYRIREHSIRGYGGLVLSLLWWQDETMLIDLDDYEERKDSRRSDGWRVRED